MCSCFIVSARLCNYQGKMVELDRWSLCFRQMLQIFEIHLLTYCVWQEIIPQITEPPTYKYRYSLHFTKTMFHAMGRQWGCVKDKRRSPFCFLCKLKFSWWFYSRSRTHKFQVQLILTRGVPYSCSPFYVLMWHYVNTIQRSILRFQHATLKVPGPIAWFFFQTFGDFGIKRKFIFSHYPWWILQL